MSDSIRVCELCLSVKKKKKHNFDAYVGNSCCTVLVYSITFDFWEIILIVLIMNFTLVCLL